MSSRQACVESSIKGGGEAQALKMRLQNCFITIRDCFVRGNICNRSKSLQDKKLNLKALSTLAIRHPCPNDDCKKFISSSVHYRVNKFCVNLCPFIYKNQPNTQRSIENICVNISKMEKRW
jgi:hypothetical protein